MTLPVPSLSRHVESASRWIYRGLWAVLVRWFKVPGEPPTLPVPPGETLDAFQPAEGFLRYLKFLFWFWLLLLDGFLLVAWSAVLVIFPLIGIALALPALAIAVLPDIVAYLAIHLRYDTTWYVMTNRSLRIRRGIWIIQETTITFENVQNVQVKQGPVQRFFGIADVHLDTAGGGTKKAEHGNLMAGHRGLIEGVADAHRIRDLILARLRRSRTAGLGDEPAGAGHQHTWTSEQLALLRDIRDAVQALSEVSC